MNGYARLGATIGAIRIAFFLTLAAIGAMRSEIYGPENTPPADDTISGPIADVPFWMY